MCLPAAEARSVVFPHPDSSASPNTSPFRIVKSMLETAFIETDGTFEHAEIERTIFASIGAEYIDLDNGGPRTQQAGGRCVRDLTQKARSTRRPGVPCDRRRHPARQSSGRW